MMVELLRSAEGDTMPKGAIERALVAVAAGTAVGAGAAVLATSSPQGLGWSLVLKNLAVSMALGVGVSAGGVALVTSLGPTNQPTMSPSTTPGPRLAPGSRTAGASPVASAKPELPVVEMLETTVPDPARSAPATNRARPSEAAERMAEPSRPVVVVSDSAPAPDHPSPAPADSRVIGAASSLALEVARIDAARRAVQSGDPTLALVEIEQYDREISRKTLGVEAALLRIDALVALGRQAEAAAIARRLLSAGLAGQHTERLRLLILENR